MARRRTVSSNARILFSLLLRNKFRARAAHREDFAKELEDNPKRKWLAERVQTIKDNRVDFIDIPGIAEVFRRFKELHPFLQPRHQRDYYRLLAFIKAHALLNCYHRREHNSKYRTIVANDKDIEAGFKLYQKIFESNELGLAPEIFEIWRNVIQPLFKYIQGIEQVGLHKEDIFRAYYQKYHRTLPDDRLRKVIIPQLSSVGLIVLEQDPEDGRKKIIKPNVANGEKLYRSEGVGEGNSEPTYPTPPPPTYISLEDFEGEPHDA